MTIRPIQILTLAVVPTVVSATHAHAQMSEAEQQAEVQRLSSVCQEDPTYRLWSQQAKSGSSRAKFEATDALLQCFYNNVDSRFPATQKQHWLEEIKANKQKERGLK